MSFYILIWVVCIFLLVAGIKIGDGSALWKDVTSAILGALSIIMLMIFIIMPFAIKSEYN